MTDNNDKYCLITLGPTGSGKSGLKDIVSNYLSSKKSGGHFTTTGELLKQVSVQILIDDIIEAHPHYKHLVNQILQEVIILHLQSLLPPED